MKIETNARVYIKDTDDVYKETPVIKLSDDTILGWTAFDTKTTENLKILKEGVDFFWTLETAESMCCRCGKNGGEEGQVCPFAAEIHGDYESNCNCCHYCAHECAMDI